MSPTGDQLGADPERTGQDEQWMEHALAEATKALEHGDVPVGAVVVRNGEIIAGRHNERELSGDPTAHAEVLALSDAAAVVGSWQLTDCTLYTTLEPCLMCGGALINARIDRLVYGAADLKAGACLSLYNVCDDPRLNHRVDVTFGVLADRCQQLLTSFFAQLR
ncbi:MAG: tRNA adenosine(34) deaminase TadA [Acidimicrobiia bacterium]|nr:tRNA adenosine(34) deaminase TadA [Acidimicrobiia bacterium]